jgi:hypothetical protein
MMKVYFQLEIIPGSQRNNPYKNVTVTYDYFMFDELRDEYNGFYKEEYGETFKDHCTYTLELERKSERLLETPIKWFPFGKVVITDFKDQDRPLKDDQDSRQICNVYPKVRSEADRRKDKDKQESEMQNREHQERSELMEKKDKKKKAKEEEEKMQLAMDKIFDKIGEVWKKIDHSFIKSIQEEGECIKELSYHYEELFPVYQAYTKQIPQTCTNKENDAILIQHFFHFVKEYEFGCNDMEGYYNLLSQLSPLIKSKMVDSFNMYNGMNFASFIEAIVRIAYNKVVELNQNEEENLEEFKDPEEEKAQNSKFSMY